MCKEYIVNHRNISISSNFPFLGGFSFLFLNKIILIQCTKLNNKVENPSSLVSTMAITSLMEGKDASFSLSESFDSVK